MPIGESLLLPYGEDTLYRLVRGFRAYLRWVGRARNTSYSLTRQRQNWSFHRWPLPRVFASSAPRADRWRPPPRGPPFLLTAPDQTAELQNRVWQFPVLGEPM
jgi:hypothetical protein